jgi:hypothetical protein
MQHPCAAGVAVEIGRIEQHRVGQPGGAGPGDVDVEEVADVHGGRRGGTAFGERQVEQPRIGFFHAPLVRVEHDVEPAREIQAVEQPPQRAVGVRHDDQPQRLRPQRRQRRDDVGRHRFPDVVHVVVGTHLGKRAVGRLVRGQAGVTQHGVEVDPAALTVVGAGHHRAAIHLQLGVGLGGDETGGGGVHAVAGQRLRHPRPVGVDQDTPGVEEDGLDGA